MQFEWDARDDADAKLVTKARDHVKQASNFEQLIFGWTAKGYSISFESEPDEENVGTAAIVILHESRDAGDDGLGCVPLTLAMIVKEFPKVQPISPDEESERTELPYSEMLASDVLSRNLALEMMASYMLVGQGSGSLGYMSEDDLLESRAADDEGELEGKDVLTLLLSYEDEGTDLGWGEWYVLIEPALT